MVGVEEIHKPCPQEIGRVVDTHTVDNGRKYWMRRTRGLLKVFRVRAE